MSFLVVTALAARLAAAAPAAPAPVAPPLCLVGASVVDPDKRTVAPADLRLENGQIAEVAAPGAAHCDGTTRLDLKGRFIFPGLIDLHVHSWGNPSPTDNDDQDVGTEKVLALGLRAGVMAMLDLAGGDERFAARDKSRGARDLADLYVAGVLMARPARGHFPVPSPEEQRRKVRARAALHPDFIKIIDVGGDPAPIIDEARKLGLRTVVHISNWEQADEVVKAGATAITHFEDEVVIPDALADAWAKKQIWSIPTMAVQCDLGVIAKDAPRFLGDPLLVAVTTPALRAAYLDPAHYTEKAREWIDWQTDGCVAHDYVTLRHLHARGVKILAGADTGNLGTFQGFSVHREIEHFARAGLPPWDALASATTLAARFLGIPWGVGKGAPANLVVTTASPIPDVANTRRLTHVIHRGHLVVAPAPEK